MFLRTNDKMECCGCKVCAEICPSHCISFQEDKEHFLYPVIDSTKCMECKLCEKVCPIKNESVRKQENIEVWAGKFLSEEVLFHSSSGGAFTAIYKTLLNKEYAIFGVRWAEQYKVIHDVAKNETLCENFRKSKYVLSDTNHCFSKVSEMLLRNEKVCFTGTPCQCTALLSFLKAKRVNCDNLMVIDIICHGAPNQYIFDRYISEKVNDSTKEYQFRFKNKIPYCGKVNSRTASLTDIEGNTEVLTARNDPFLRGYYGRLFYRPYCSMCEFASPERVSDITIGDAWHIENVYSDWNSLEGVSLLLINSEKGNKLLKEIQNNNMMLLRKMDIDWAVKNNAQLREPTIMNPKRDKFFELLECNQFEDAVNRSMASPIYKKILRKIKHYFLGGGRTNSQYKCQIECIYNDNGKCILK